MRACETPYRCTDARDSWSRDWIPLSIYVERLCPACRERMSAPARRIDARREKVAS